ncbi:MAG: ABC transporter substrate-binding protein [Verrucomicrobiales bacterium]|nr:ABC transporter substrate-binding protein [Verrucomicrobiales bacterium]
MNPPRHTSSLSLPHAVAAASVRAAVSLALRLLVPIVIVVPHTQAATPESLVVLSPHNEAIREEFERGFSRWHLARHGADVDLDWRVVGGSSESLKFVQSEYARKPDGIGIDVFFGGGQEPYFELADKHWAVPCALPDSVLSGIPQDVVGIPLRAEDRSWFGAAISSFGILQNLRVQSLAHLPRALRWEDLTRPELEGWVGAGDPRGSGTMHVMFESFLQAHGWDRGWRMLTQLAGNTRRFDRVSSTTAKDAAVGETAYALAVDFYAFSQIAAAGKEHLTFVLPQDFAAINPDGIALLHGAPHREVACRFLEFVLSDAGQQLWMLPRGHPDGPSRHSIERMPVRPALYERHRGVSNVEFSPFDLHASFRYDARLAQQRRGVIATLSGALLVDVHDDLKTAWKAVIRRGLDPADLVEFGRPPLTEQEARALSVDSWKNPAVRNAKRAEWQRWALTKYQGLARTSAPPIPPAARPPSPTPAP